MADENDVSLKEFVLKLLDDIRNENDRRFAAQEKAVETAFNAAKEAVIKSEIGVEKRSDAVYVSLSKLQEALASLMPRAEAEQRFSSLLDTVAELKTANATNEGQNKGSDITMSKIVTAIGLVGTVLGIIILFANNVI